MAPAANPESSAIGARIREARLKAELAQDDLAHAVGVRVTQVSRWERGVNTPTGAMCSRLASKLNVPVGWLLGDESAGASTGSDDEHRIPSRAEILMPHPQHGAWDAFLEQHAGLVAVASDSELYQAKSAYFRTGTPKPETYAQLVMALRNTDRVEMSVTDEQRKRGEEVKASLAARVKRRKSG